MSQIPEDLLQKFMQMTGMSRSEAKKALTKSISEMTNGPVFKAQMPKQKVKQGVKPKYDVVNYPHFLPSNNVRKYTIRVSLKGTNIPIWRKFECPSNISLRHLTELVLKLMGWWNEHLNQIEGPYGTLCVPSYQYDPNNSWVEPLFQEEYKLSDILSEKGKSVKWEYDFGDSWMHVISLSSIDEYAENEPHKIIFKSGKGACPPENCGGIWGYQDILELIEKRKSSKRLTSEEKERLEWYGMNKDYDPEKFDREGCVATCNKFTESSKKEESADVTKNSHTKELVKMSPLYDDILSLSFKIRELEPWEDLDDSDVYAIRMHDGSEIYVVTLGYGGESYDVQLYDGQASFQTYIKIAKSDFLPEFEMAEAYSWADHISIVFHDPEDMIMEPAQYHLIEEWAKDHNIEIADEHGYPFPQKGRPHYFPTMQMSDEELSRLKEALDAIVWFSQQILDAEELTDFGFKPYREYATDKGGKVVPLIVCTTDGYKVERTQLPGKLTQYETISLPESELQPLRSLQKKGAQFCRLIHTPGFIGSENDKGNAYRPLIFICLNKKDGFLSITEICDVTDTFERDVLRQYIKKVKREDEIPLRIITDDSRTEAILRDFCKQLGIILDFKRTRIPELAQACQELSDMSES